MILGAKDILEAQIQQQQEWVSIYNQVVIHMILTYIYQYLSYRSVISVIMKGVLSFQIDNLSYEELQKKIVLLDHACEEIPGQETTHSRSVRDWPNQ